MFTGSAVRVQAVQDLKLQEGQEIGRRSWKSGCQHPQSPVEARKREGREQEVEAGEQEENPRKTPKSQNLASLLFPLAVSLLCPLLFPTLFISYLFLLHPTFLSLAPSVSSETIYYSHYFISLFLFDGQFEPRTLQDNTPHYQSDGPHFESSKLFAPTQTLEDPF